MPSLVISSYEYDPANLVLRVKYVSGITYEYMGVPETIYTAMKNAFSKGIYLNQHIKGKFTYRKLG
jgi:KTSC domain